MTADAQQLQDAVDAFLKKYDFTDEGTKIYSQKEWNDRGEQYCLNSPFVLTFDGPFYNVMNWGYGDTNDHAIHTEFYNLVQGLGWYWEQGTAWYAGFYKK